MPFAPSPYSRNANITRPQHTGGRITVNGGSRRATDVNLSLPRLSTLLNLYEEIRCCAGTNRGTDRAGGAHDGTQNSQAPARDQAAQPSHRTIPPHRRCRAAGDTGAQARPPRPRLRRDLRDTPAAATMRAGE